MAEVATAATVSLIDPVLNETRATALTDSQGIFVLSLDRRMFAGKQIYYLEAVKGLSSNAVGRDAVRVRTVISWQSGIWASISGDHGAGIVLNTSTTALGAILSLRQGTTTASLLIGTLSVGTPSESRPDTFQAEGTGIADTEFDTVYHLVATSLAADVDPFDALRYEGGIYSLKPGVGHTEGIPFLYLQPAIASVGSAILINGAGFSPTLTGNTVTFAGGQTAAVATASATSIRVTVPPGATTGPVTVVAGESAATASFTLLPVVSGGLQP